MSLINKVLTDLEARNRDKAPGTPRSVLQDLHPAEPVATRRKEILGVFAGALVLLVTAVVVYGLFAWQPQAAKSKKTAEATPTTAQANRLPASEQALAVQKPAPQDPGRVATTEQASGNSTSVARMNESQALPEPAAPATAKPSPAATTASPAKPAVAGTEMPAKRTAPVTKPASEAKPGKATASAAARNKSATPDENATIEKTERPLTAADKAENAYRTAVNSLKARRVAEAEAGLKAALAQNPRHTGARELLASVWLERGQWPQALATLEEGSQLLPQHVPFAQLLARLYVEQGKEQQALAVLERVRPAAANDAEVMAFLAALYQRANRHGDAADAYRAALVQRPNEAAWWLGLGISLEAEQHLREAQVAYVRAQQSGNLKPALARYVADRLAYLKSKLQ